MTDIFNEADEANEINQRIISYIERIERLQEELKELQGDVKDVFDEAKNSGFDKKALREVIKLRKLDVSVREEQDYLVETYRKALDI